MKTGNFGYLIATLAFALASARADLAPTSMEVVKLAKAGMTEEVMVSYVKGAVGKFHLSADDIIALKAQGVPLPVIAVMLNHDSEMRDQSPSPTAYVPPAPVQVSAVALTPTAYVPPAPAPAYAPTPPVTSYVAAPVEVIPVSPGPDYYWTPGYWGNGVWIGGTWACGGIGVSVGAPFGWYGYRGYGGWGYRDGYHGFRGRR